MSTHPSPPQAAFPPVERRDACGAEAEFVASWLAHLEAGRLGSFAQMSPEELATQRANEMAVLGRTPSFPALPQAQPRPGRWGR